MDMAPLDLQTMLSQLGLALLLGALLGLDRELRDKPAGLRTLMLVSAGCAGVTMLTYTLLSESAPALAENVRQGLESASGSERGERVDPSRVIAGVLSGIGFLGAGTIIQSRGNVEGITTAATIWLTAGVGMACGYGQWQLAVAITVGGLLTLVGVGFLERMMFARKREDKLQPDRAQK